MGAMTGWGAIALLALTLKGGAMTIDTTVSGYDGLHGPRFELVALDGAPFPARAQIEFLPGGMIRGDGPCNGFAAPQVADWPAFELGAIRATKMACADLEAEQSFFAHLRAATRIAVEGEAETLILDGPDGARMEFAPVQPD